MKKIVEALTGGMTGERRYTQASGLEVFALSALVTIVSFAILIVSL